MTNTSQIQSSEHEELQISRLLNGLSAMAVLFLAGIGVAIAFAVVGPSSSEFFNSEFPGADGETETVNFQTFLDPYLWWIVRLVLARCTRAWNASMAGS